MSDDMRSRAVALAKRGFRVFKLIVNDKEPAVPEFYRIASSGPDRVYEMWTCNVTRESLHNNIGIATGEGLLVLDIDVKKNRAGDKSLKTLIDAGLISLDGSYVVRTPSGGLHVYCGVPADLKISGKTNFWPGIDLRGYHNYVCAEGSEVNGCFYICKQAGDPFLALGDELIQLLPRATEKVFSPSIVPGAELDSEAAIKRGIEYLRDKSPEAVEGCRGSTALGVAYELGDYGISEISALELMEDLWNSEKVFPPMDSADLETSVQNAYRYRKQPLGCASPEVQFSQVEIETASPKGIAKIPLTIDQWESRDIPPLDPLLGELITTTTRAELIAPTGLGKTNFSMSLAMHVAAGKNFLHWHVPRPARVLYVDGEMSRRLYKKRILSAADMLGAKPKTFYAFNHEDLSKFAPLNTKLGQAQIDGLIEHVGGVDFVVFDSVMCLIAGDMKDEESWAETLPWARTLTRRQIGQLWVHHTGHDEKRGYGTKTREWQLDVVMMMQRENDIEAPVAFTLSFPKAREREPDNATDFAPMKIWLSHKTWHHRVVDSGTAGHVPPMAAKFFQVLRGIATVDEDSIDGSPSAPLDDWKAACIKNGLIDSTKTANSQRAVWYKYKDKLIEANWVRCDTNNAWILK